ncbi:MAG: hypothetical protein HFH54_08540 [Lachnospiraceae bacterium]|jgi:hypothetical protein|nr:hypothetical protein [Lachnospiraceae bacterium]
MEDKENPFHVFYDSYLNTNACTECTGLIPSLAEDDREWNAYREVFDFEAVPEKATKPGDTSPK